MPIGQRLRFGFSPCPNDTFAFWAAVHGVVPAPIGLDAELADIEQLNARAVAGGCPLPLTKLSLPALAACVDRYAVLQSGAALGFGNGPLVVCRAGSGLRRPEDLARARVAIPGAHTTANLLLRCFLPEPREVVALRFDQVMPAVAGGRCDAGVVIHESRFTYREHGLRALVDLGELWERQTGGPLALGVIAASRALDAATFGAVEELLRSSVRLARAAPDRPRAYVRRHASELDEEVQDRHIALYVNDFTEELGATGRRAIEELLRRGRAAGFLPAGGSPFRSR